RIGAVFVGISEDGDGESCGDGDG
nr:hypothetical protein [Tanacetum cinerariifolium]